MSAAPAEIRAASAKPQAAAPNIVIILADDLGWNAVGYHDGFAKTPNIDRIAAEGVQLDRFYSAPMCSPTRAGILTGRYAMHLGMGRSVVRPWIHFGLSPSERTLPEALAEAGYAHRGAFGKWHLGHHDPKWHPLSQGFTAFEGCYNGAQDYWTQLREDELDWHRDFEPTRRKGYTTDLITNAACDFIASSAAGDEPFFCYVPYTAPHDPLQAPQSYVDQYKHLDGRPRDGKPSNKQKLAAMITAMDDGVGRVLETLEKSGALENTIVWFMSDNGGVGGIRGNNDPLRAAKLTVYEGGVRVPSAVWWPGKIEGGRKVTAPVMHVDVMPTLLALAGKGDAANGGKPLDGVDVSKLLTTASDEAAAAATNRDLYYFNGQFGSDVEQIAVTSADGWKLVVVGPDLRQSGFRTPAHKFELFHLAEDPLEKHNVAAEHSDVVDALGKKLVDFRESEPEEAIAPAEKPDGYQPPKEWRNSPVDAAAAKTPATADLRQADGQPKLETGAKKGRPNIVVILADDLGFSDVGCYGSEIRTPNIDRLAAGGVRFRQFYNNGRCCPSRAALLTGRYPHQVGVGAMIDGYAKWIRDAADRPSYDDHLSKETPTVAELLQDAGYQTYMVGKWHLGDRPGEWPVRRGFDRSFALVPGAMNYFGGESTGPRAFMVEDDQHYEPPHDGFFATDAFTDRAVEFLAESQQRDEPFFLYMAYNAPHWPLHAPPEDVEKYRGVYDKGWQAVRDARYQRMIDMGVIDDSVQMAPMDRGDVKPWDELSEDERAEWALRMEIFAAQVTGMDEGIGRIVDELERRGVADNTLVLVISDNGGAPEDPHRGRSGAELGGRDSFWGYARPWATVSNTPWRRHKVSMYEGGISTPAIARWPAGIPASEEGSLVDGPAHLMDLLPTFLELAGARPSQDDDQPKLEGRNIEGMIRGEDAPANRTLCWEHEGNRAIRRGDWKLVQLSTDKA
ncbi:MAG TPA: sulfatase-like hydrolase/transferase, partial [Lacipirellula sp.]